MGIVQKLVDFISKEDDDAGGLLRDKSLSWVLAITRNVLVLFQSLSISLSRFFYFNDQNTKIIEYYTKVYTIYSVLTILVRNPTCFIELSGSS